MPEDTTEETASEPQTYMIQGRGDTLTIPDEFAAQHISDFSTELAAMRDGDESVSTTSPEKANADHTALIEQLGGSEAATALAQVLDDPNTNLAQILPAAVVEDVVWQALDSPVTQQNILQDPEVRAVISRELLHGNKIEDVQALLANYERGDGARLVRKFVESN